MRSGLCSLHIEVLVWPGAQTRLLINWDLRHLCFLAGTILVLGKAGKMWIARNLCQAGCPDPCVSHSDAALQYMQHRTPSQSAHFSQPIVHAHIMQCTFYIMDTINKLGLIVLHWMLLLDIEPHTRS